VPVTPIHDPTARYKGFCYIDMLDSMAIFTGRHEIRRLRLRPTTAWMGGPNSPEPRVNISQDDCEIRSSSSWASSKFRLHLHRTACIINMGWNLVEARGIMVEFLRRLLTHISFDLSFPLIHSRKHRLLKASPDVDTFAPLTRSSTIPER